jgi:uncharacterized protein
VLAHYRARGLDIAEIPENGSTADRAAATESAMREGHDVIYQACFRHDGWIGFADFLVRVDEPTSSLGVFSYEVEDAKLAREPRPAYVFQLLFYDREVTRIQGVRPRRMHLILGDGERESFPPEEFEAYGDEVRTGFAARRAELTAGTGDPVAYPYKVADCGMCAWWAHCDARRRADDHVSLVATLARSQAIKLDAAGVSTVGALAQLPAGERLERIAPETLVGLKLQARLQLESRLLPTPTYELLEPEAGRGLHRLPARSEGDVFFDFEGDPYWGEEGLEYLFGTGCLEAGEWRYRPLWAQTRAQEKARFEEWIDWLMARLEAFPALHVFHYNAYEPTAVKRLAARHATREQEVDELLRRRVFVDLYGVVRQALRIGTESYGLKALEVLHGFRRRGQSGSLRGWSEYLETGDTTPLAAIEVYNEDDCRSTESLLRWLADRRPEAEARFGIELDELAPKEPEPPSDRRRAYLEKVEARRGPLTGALPDNEQDDTEEQRALRIMFDLLGYHLREDKPAWWAHFARLQRSVEELRDDDPDAIGDLRPVGGAQRREEGRSYVWTLRYPDQEHKLAVGSVRDQDDCAASILALDEATRTVEVRRVRTAGEVPPVSLLPRGPFEHDAQIDALFAVADRVIAAGLRPAGSLDAGVDLLVRRAPRFAPGTPPLRGGRLDLEVLKAQVRGLQSSALVIQGPPGSGKTYTGARLAVELIARGTKVGVVSSAHKAIINMLRAIDEAADEAGVDFVGWKKSNGDGTGYESARFSCGSTPPGDEEGAGAPVCVGATAWHWTAADNAGCVEVLFVDEAGQMSLADAIACSRGASSLVLLGDPQQLAHVGQGTHPHGSGASVLQHLLGARATVPDDAGVFLDRSWRMHPDVCRFVSDAMYDRKLAAVERCALQRVESRGLSGTGLRWLAVEHLGNRQRSEEEVEAIRAQIDLLVGGRFVDCDGGERELTLDDILVVAPYNAQVRRLQAAMPDARVGTVDKFQGQEAPVVFFSMTSSSGDDVPRGLDFLFSKNRLNVAVSRAQALAVVVCSPSLLRSRCRTVSDMQLINMLCRFTQAASRV